MIYAIFIILFTEENKKYHVFTKAFTFFMVPSEWLKNTFTFYASLWLSIEFFFHFYSTIKSIEEKFFLNMCFILIQNILRTQLKPVN